LTPSSPLHVAYFDLETRRLAKEIPGGWDAIKRGDGGISALVVLDSLYDYPNFYDDHCLSALADHLESADVVCSYNGKRFDVPIVEGLLGRSLALPRHIDLLDLIWSALNLTHCPHRGNSLAEVSQRTLGQTKNGTGELAPTLSDAGRFAELFTYCLCDVDLTRRLFDYARREGGVIGPNGDFLSLAIPDWFRS
jgi:hypothetical protein